MADILIIDDDLEIRNGFRSLLEGEGYTVRTARNGREGLKRFTERRPDLVLLDVMMPGDNGIVVCGRLRELDGLVPILFFTAMNSDVTMVRALGKGADDYISKSRPPEEFLARIASALRRSDSYAEYASRQRITVGGVAIDVGSRRATGDDVDCELTKGEMAVIGLLDRERGMTVPAERIFSAVAGEGCRGTVFAVRMNIMRLRRKLGRAGELIVTGEAGYKLLK